MDLYRSMALYRSMVNTRRLGVYYTQHKRELTILLCFYSFKSSVAVSTRGGSVVIILNTKNNLPVLLSFHCLKSSVAVLTRGGSVVIILNTHTHTHTHKTYQFYYLFHSLKSSVAVSTRGGSVVIILNTQQIFS